MLILIVCQLAGESLKQWLGLPVPGPVIGMFMLAAGLVARGGQDAVTEDGAADLLVRHLGLLFVPAGVGIMSEMALLRAAWLPLAAGLVVSTLMSVAATGVVMHRLGGR